MLAFVVILIPLINDVTITRADIILEAVYWEIKPFLFTNKNGDLDGIIPRMFEKGQEICLRNQNETLLRFIRKEKSRKSFYDLLHSRTRYGEDSLVNISKPKATWLPSVAFYDLRNESFENFRNVKNFKLMKSVEMAVIVPRYIIALPNKILRGLLSCQHIVIISVLFSIFFGILIWMLECLCNEEFSRSFFRGSGAGIWWSFISMSTLGYGDIIPRSFFGRLTALVWLFLGVVIACVMTATTTQVVAGVDHLSVYGRRVSVLENSIEAKEASENYGADIVSVSSYEEALQLVRDGTVFAAMMNADIAAWYQDDIWGDEHVKHNTPLRIVKTLPALIDINILLPKDLPEYGKSIFKCMHNKSDLMYSDPVYVYRKYCHIDMLHEDSLADLFKENVFSQVLLAIITVLILVGIIFEIYTRRCNKRVGEQLPENGQLHMELINGDHEADIR